LNSIGFRIHARLRGDVDALCARLRRNEEPERKVIIMPRGDKSKYTGKQKRQAEHIEEGYEERGLPAREAKRRAWATVNKTYGGGEKPGGGGYGRGVSRAPARKGGRLGGRAAASRPAAARRASARKAARTRARRASTRAGSRRTTMRSRARRTTARSRR